MKKLRIWDFGLRIIGVALLCVAPVQGADLTLSANMDTLLQAANFGAARTSLGVPATSLTLTIAGTANEITSSAGAQDLSANRTWTLSLPAALTFTGKTVTGGTFAGPVVTGNADFGTAGVRITTDGDGAITFLGMGNGSDEDLTLNLDDTANTVVVSSSTGVTVIDFGTIGLTTSGTGTIGTMNATVFQIGGVAVSSSAAELNILDGATLTVTELNHVDGVTSAIQTQLDAKQGLTHSSANDPDISTEGHLAWDANGDYLRGYDGTNQVAVARKIEAIHCTVVLPNDLADSERDAFWVWSNESGMSFIVTGWKAWSDTDDTTLNIEEIDADGQNNATVDAVEIATNGTGLFTGSDTTITAATIENGHLLVLDFDDTDTPGQVKVTIFGYYAADVN